MTLKELEKRLKTLEDIAEVNQKRLNVMEDIEEIKKVHHAYVYALNARKFDDIIDLFADDMVEDGFPAGETRIGKKEVEKVWRAMDEGSRDRPYLHATIVAQPMITVDGDKAKGYWLWLGRINDPRRFISDSDQEGDEVIQIRPKLGRYDMEYKRVEGKWKISYLKFTVPWPVVKKLKQ